MPRKYPRQAAAANDPTSVAGILSREPEVLELDEPAAIAPVPDAGREKFDILDKDGEARDLDFVSDLLAKEPSRELPLDDLMQRCEWAAAAAISDVQRNAALRRLNRDKRFKMRVSGRTYYVRHAQIPTVVVPAHSVAWLAGHAAHAAQQGITDNPHREGAAVTEWEDGWIDAENATPFESEDDAAEDTDEPAQGQAMAEPPARPALPEMPAVPVVPSVATVASFGSDDAENALRMRLARLSRHCDEQRMLSQRHKILVSDVETMLAAVKDKKRDIDMVLAAMAEHALVDPEAVESDTAPHPPGKRGVDLAGRPIVLPAHKLIGERATLRDEQRAARAQREAMAPSDLGISPADMPAAELVIVNDDDGTPRAARVQAPLFLTGQAYAVIREMLPDGLAELRPLLTCDLWDRLHAADFGKAKDDADAVAKDLGLERAGRRAGLIIASGPRRWVIGPISDAFYVRLD